MIDAVLFDIDGTLLDSEAIFYNTLKSSLETHDLPSIIISSKKLFGLSVNETLNALGIPTRSDVKKTWEDLFIQGCSSAQLYDGILNTIKQLYTLERKIVLVTSRSKASTEALIYSLNINEYITGIVTAEDTVLHKPHPDPLLLALDLFQLSPHSTVYIGDTFNDYYSAKQAHIQFGSALWNKSAFNDSSCLKFNNPKEIVNYVMQSRTD